MNNQKLGTYNIQMQKIINEEINQDGIYYAYVQAVVNGSYNKALELNQEMQRRASKIYSESEGDRKEQVKLTLGLLAKASEDIQIEISKHDCNQENK